MYSIHETNSVNNFCFDMWNLDCEFFFKNAIYYYNVKTNNKSLFIISLLLVRLSMRLEKNLSIKKYSFHLCSEIAIQILKCLVKVIRLKSRRAMTKLNITEI